MTAKDSTAWEFVDFSLVDGGLLYEIWRRMRLAGHFLKMICGRIGVLLLIAWVPLLLLSLFEGSLWNESLKLPFVYDVETHLRLLVALPLLVLAETFVHQKLRPIVGQFTERHLVPEQVLPLFQRALDSAIRLRNSVTAELILFALVFLVGILFIRPAPTELDMVSWRASAEMQWSRAGRWLEWVSLPLFQFLLARWYWRLFIWARFLRQVSKLQLNIVPTHSDCCGGLNFLALGTLAFAPLLLAQGTLLAAMIANQIFYGGAKLTDFKLEFFGLMAVLLIAVLAPLMVFIPKLAAVKRGGMIQYGALAQRYVQQFDRKWLHGGVPGGEPLMGSADIQSLADLSNAYAVIERMRPVPFGLQTVAQLSLLTVLPVLPLALTIVPLKELSERLIKIIL